MKIRVTLSESLYDCDLQITDMQGTRWFRIYVMDESDVQEQFLDIDVFGGEFELTVMPQMADYRSAMNEFEESDWKDKLAKKTVNLLFSAFENMLLRVGCKYSIQGLQEGDTLNITGQQYVFGTFDRFDLLELIPMVYMYYEASWHGNRFRLLDAFGLNRREVVKSAKKLALMDLFGNGLFLLFTYPIQVGRVKHISKNKKIFKTLCKFNDMDEAQRQRILDKQEKLFSS